MRIEQLLGKFGLKGINYEPTTGGRGLLSVEEQIASVGICWQESPAGWLLLFVEVCNDALAYSQLHTIMKAEANRHLANMRGSYPDQALDALAATAIHEAATLTGRVCPECNGAGKVKTASRHMRKCAACKEGRIPWNNETRFARFAQELPVTFGRFNRYKPALEHLVDWLTMGRTAALLAIEGRLEKEKEEARKVA
ncbi:hypothetical protein BZJ19_10110 [Salinivibrio proteolyticus]|uniref:hypothetical protein n=1 Tax=Salinivibrio proteolyticus TaxID=334715 RepID=UPI00098918F0|nr:hypothetical protein [Salinivibrio proteolyticus]OOF25064.1 hypothetical protein BZJ19_10110 [Salinivibrio proteolyticus]